MIQLEVGIQETGKVQFDWGSASDVRLAGCPQSGGGLHRAWCQTLPCRNRIPANRSIHFRVVFPVLVTSRQHHDSNLGVVGEPLELKQLTEVRVLSSSGGD